MEADDDPHRRRPWSLPSWRRIGDFFLTLAQLERAYQALKAQNERLVERVDKLQQQVDDQNGQLKILTTFVEMSIRENLGANAEKAAARYIERLIARRSDPQDDDR